jgi:carbonic anhydrase
MYEIIYRYDPAKPEAYALPPDPAAARARLEEGNRAFAGLLDAPPEGRRVLRYDELGAPGPDGRPALQAPFAAVLGCSDARVPLEIVFGQGFNDLFVVRVAGNVLGDECLGSLDFAAANFPDSLKLVVVLGHARCGAVTAAVDSFLSPANYLGYAPSHPLRLIVDRLMVPVRAAHQAVDRAWGPAAAAKPGYRDALVAAAVRVNAALTAATVRHELRNHFGPGREVLFGVYDLATRRVEAPDGSPGLAAPPADLAGFDDFGAVVAHSPPVRDRLA